MSNQKSKDLDYYMSLNYELILKRIVEDGTARWYASTRELSPAAFYGTGESPQEAIRNFEDTKRVLFQHFLDEGLAIAEPMPEREELPGGRILLRVTPRLHARLIHLAESGNTSLNTLISTILEKHAVLEAAQDYWMQVRTVVGASELVCRSDTRSETPKIWNVLPLSSRRQSATDSEWERTARQA